MLPSGDHVRHLSNCKCDECKPATHRKPIPNDGVELIAAERKRQVEKEGWTPEHDDSHLSGELAAAAIAYATPYHIKGKSLISGEYVCDVWPWDADEYKPTTRIRDLAKAGALIAAEIDRLRRRALAGETK